MLRGNSLDIDRATEAPAQEKRNFFTTWNMRPSEALKCDTPFAAVLRGGRGACPREGERSCCQTRSRPCRGRVESGWLRWVCARLPDSGKPGASLHFVGAATPDLPKDLASTRGRLSCTQELLISSSRDRPGNLASIKWS